MENQPSEAQPPQAGQFASDQQISGPARFVMRLFLLVFLAFGLMLFADLLSGILR
jgi:hypothetical protein